MNERTFSVAIAILLGMALAAGRVSAVPFQENNTYDLSQTANNMWSNYCAPTAAGDLVYHFGKTYPTLVQNKGYGPGLQADTDAENVIGGANPPNNADPPGGPGATAGSLAQLMGTTRTTGTTLDNLKTGVDSYLKANSTISWETHELKVGSYPNPKGANFLSDLQTDLSNGADVILVVAWQNATPPAAGSYTVPSGYDSGVLGSSVIGHAFEMIGYDSGSNTILVNDPANNAANSWGAEATPYNVAANLPANLEFNVQGATAIAYGAVVVNSPEPSTLWLLAASVVGLGAFGLRRLARARRQKA
ncbi:MAG: PEP-CTERM sorting domain-containing protein [Thermoguttaceae bacterium]|jgi:hypothetical protein